MGVLSACSGTTVELLLFVTCRLQGVALSAGVCSGNGTEISIGFTKKGKKRGRIIESEC